MYFTKSAVIFALIACIQSPAYSKTLDCWLPSAKDGSEIKRFEITSKASLTVFETRKARSYRKEFAGVRKVTHSHDSNPKDSRTDLNWEEPHTIILLESRSSDGLEFAPDILIVDWGKGNLKTLTPYDNAVTTRWTCSRLD